MDIASLFDVARNTAEKLDALSACFTHINRHNLVIYRFVADYRSSFKPGLTLRYDDVNHELKELLSLWPDYQRIIRPPRMERRCMG